MALSFLHRLVQRVLKAICIHRMDDGGQRRRDPRAAPPKFGARSRRHVARPASLRSDRALISALARLKSSVSGRRPSLSRAATIVRSHRALCTTAQWFDATSGRKARGDIPRLRVRRRRCRAGRRQPDGTVRGGTVVLGTVIGPPPPLELLDPDELEAGFPAPWVRWRRTSRVPVLAVVTKPPMLGFEMSDWEKGMVMSVRTSISLPTRSAETVNVTLLVTPCMSRAPVRVVMLHDAVGRDRTQGDRRGERQGGRRVLADVHDGAVEVRVALALVARDARHVDGEGALGHGGSR